MSNVRPIGNILDDIRMEYFYAQYELYVRDPGNKQISFDDFCDQYYELNFN